jgi:branched-subunit amino acid aminotransferase/4-amino-4-deoxychorismate lyase
MTVELLETVRVCDGLAPLWPLHRRRLGAAARALGIHLGPLPQASGIVLAAAGIASLAAVRLVAGGCQIRLEARAVSTTSVPWRVTVLPDPRPPDPLAAYKTTQRGVHQAARSYAQQRDCEEALWTNAQGHLTEGSISNLFIRRRGQICTPPAQGGDLLAGIARGRLLHVGVLEGWPVVQRAIGLSDLLDADEAFVTNAVRGAIPLGSVDGQLLRQGTVWRTAHAVIFAPIRDWDAPDQAGLSATR